jgi:predicted dinucleotide-binding enzyme
MNNTKNLKIGILGAGNIGKTLARKLAQAGHDVKVANSRSPETYCGRCAGVWCPRR